MRSALVMSAAALLISSCAARPRAELALIQQPSDLDGTEIDTYAFPRTYLDLSSAANGGDIQVATRRVSYERFRIALRKRDSFGVKTNLNLKKTDNSDLLQEAGVEVFDNRIKVIEDIGKIATTVVGLGLTPFAADSSIEVPYTIDTLRLMMSMKREGSPEETEMPSTWPKVNGIHYWVGPVSPDAAEATAQAVSGMRSGIVYSACREFRLYFPGDKVWKHLFVSDPRYLRSVAFPQKGKISVATECGVSVTSEKDESVSRDSAVAEAVLQQLKELKDVVDKRNEKEDSEPAEASTDTNAPPSSSTPNADPRP